MADTTQSVITEHETEQVERANATRPDSPSCSSTACGCCRAAGTAGPPSSRRPGYTAADTRLARRSRDRRGGQRAPGGLRPQDRRPGRRPLRRGDRQADEEAGRHRALLRRAADPDPRRARPLGRVGRHRSRAVPRRAAAADLGAQVGVAGARQPRQPHRAVPLTYEQFRFALRQRRRARTRPRALRRPSPCRRRARRCSRPPPRTSTRGPRRRSTARTRPRAAADHLRREGQHGPWAIANASYKKQKRNEGVTEIVEMPGPRARADHRQRLARGRRHRAGLRQALRLAWVRMAAGPATMISAEERPLLAGARRGDEDAFRRLVEPYRGELHAHATGCSARSMTPRTPCRTRCCARGAPWRSSRGEARCARGCTRSRPTRA